MTTPRHYDLCNTSAEIKNGIQQLLNNNNDFAVVSLLCGSDRSQDTSHSPVLDDPKSLIYKDTWVFIDDNSNLTFITDGPGSHDFSNPMGACNAAPSIDEMAQQQTELFAIMAEVRREKGLGLAVATNIGFNRGAAAAMQLSSFIHDYIDLDKSAYILLDPVTGQPDLYVNYKNYNAFDSDSKCLTLKSTNLTELNFNTGFGPTEPIGDHIHRTSIYGTHDVCIDTLEIWNEIKKCAEAGAAMGPNAKFELIRDKANQINDRVLMQDFTDKSHMPFNHPSIVKLHQIVNQASHSNGALKIESVQENREEKIYELAQAGFSNHPSIFNKYKNDAEHDHELVKCCDLNTIQTPHGTILLPSMRNLGHI